MFAQLSLSLREIEWWFVVSIQGYFRFLWFRTFEHNFPHLFLRESQREGKTEGEAKALSV